jgi:hypothetical protein
MILCTSIAVDDGGDDILDTLFTNGIDDDNGVFIFNDLFLLVALLLLSTLAIIILRPLSMTISQFVCKNMALLSYL